MKKLIFALVFSGIALSVLSSLEKKDFDRIVDFSLDLKGISRAVQTPGFDPRGHERVVIFEGAVNGILVLNAEPGDFLAEIEVAGGEWEGTQSISVFRVFVYVMGPEFARRIAVDTDEGGQDAISRNARILVAGSIDSVYTSEADGKNYAVILAHYIRVVP
ncbi:MAG: hypothetical protein LBK13_11775 [Spirochaetales bacterium]|jgi:hypothetical protein|nr:hypothetical protein [Spirochaetales bacterium]